MDAADLHIDKQSGSFRCTIAIDRPAEDVYAVLSDVESWPQWLPTVTAVTRLKPSAPVAAGSGERTTGRSADRPSGAFRVKQPRLPAAVWRVTHADPPRSFTWVSRRGGITVTGGHVVEADDGGRTRVTLSIDRTGPLLRLFGPLTASLTAEYVRREAEALKRRCEGEAPADGARPAGAEG